MLYLFSGDDTKNKILNYEKFIKSIPVNIETFFINRNTFDSIQIESFYSSNGLFFSKCMIIFSDLFEREETRDFILEKLNLMSKSENSFLFLEGKVNKDVLDAFKKVINFEPKRTKINNFELPKEKKEKFDNFLVANAFTNKDKLNTWIYFRQAMDRGVSLEEIVGVIFWKIKDTILKNNFVKFKEKELKKIVSRLSYLLPQARKDGKDAEAVLEQFFLEVL